MTKYDEYCYNLMENAIKQGSERHGLPQEECVALMNIMLGVRGVENYIKQDEEYGPMEVACGATVEEFKETREWLKDRLANKEREDDINGETMGD